MADGVSPPVQAVTGGLTPRRSPPARHFFRTLARVVGNHPMPAWSGRMLSERATHVLSSSLVDRGATRHPGPAVRLAGGHSQEGPASTRGQGSRRFQASPAEAGRLGPVPEAAQAALQLADHARRPHRRSPAHQRSRDPGARGRRARGGGERFRQAGRPDIQAPSSRKRPSWPSCGVKKPRSGPCSASATRSPSSRTPSPTCVST